MAEYIEREAAIEKTEAFCDVFVTKWTDEKVLAWIKNLPAADVAPVVHGEWRWAEDGHCKCTVCGQYATVKRVVIKTNFCPNCGADMRERKGDDA